MAVFICDLELHKRIPRIVQMEREAGTRHPGEDDSAVFVVESSIYFRNYTIWAS